MECLDSALELTRAEDSREGMIVVLSNLGCLHNLLDCQVRAPRKNYLHGLHDFVLVAKVRLWR